MKEWLAELWYGWTQSVLLRVFWEIVWTIIFAWILAAILAFPLWGVITTFLWPNVGYLGAWYMTATITTGICIVMWIIDIAKGVRM